jgi:hypothetical protein
MPGRKISPTEERRYSTYENQACRLILKLLRLIPKVSSSLPQTLLHLILWVLNLPPVTATLVF